MKPSASLRRQINAYCAWHRLTRTCMLFQHVLFAGIAVLALYVVCDKLLFIGIDRAVMTLAVASLGALVLLAYHVFVPRDVHQTGYVIDRTAGLKNLVASGLSVAGEGDEVSAVVVTRAAEALTKQRPRKLLPFSLIWPGRHLYIPAVVLIAAFFIPQTDLLGRKKEKDKAREEAASVQKGALKLAAKLTSIEKKSESFQSIEEKKITKDFNVLATNLMGTARKDALIKLGEFENKYNKEFSEQRNFEQAAKMLPAAPDMKGLSAESRKDLQDLAKDLKDGNFNDAAKALRELAKHLQSKDLPLEERKALARELSKLAERLQTPGSGLNKDLAELLRRIEASPEDLQNLLEQCQAVSQEMGELARFCEECDGFKAMKEGLLEAKKAMLGDSFSGFDAKEVEQYMETAARLGACESEGEGEGAYLGLAKGRGIGNGTGGEGIGRGGQPPEGATQTAFKNQMSQSKINQGKILQQLFVSGVPEKGDAAAEYASVVEAAKRHAASSLARDKVPREYEDMVKTYFDSLEIQSGKNKETKGDDEK